MKKMTALLLAFCVLFTLTLGCAETVAEEGQTLTPVDDPAELIGLWKLDPEWIDRYAADMSDGYMEFREDRTCKLDLYLDGGTEAFYTVTDGVLVIDGEEAAVIGMTEDGRLWLFPIGSDKNMVFVLTEDGQTEDGQTLTPVDDPAELIGLWKLDPEWINGFITETTGTSPDDPMFNVYVQIYSLIYMEFLEDGTCRMLLNPGMYGEATEAEYNVVDGVLFIDGEEWPGLGMTEDGRLSISFSSDMNMIFVRSDAE